MKTIILAGGHGTRLHEYTQTIPKPMVKIGNKPIIEHIIDYYSSYQFNNFYLALGYKGQVIKNYFKNKNKNNIQINLIDTGNKTLTGGRLKKMKKFIGNETFFLTYGDGLANVNLKKLLKFHKKNKKKVTVTAVRPVARFGELKLKGNKVYNFKEKPQTSQSWINGGFFVMEPEFLDYIDSDLSILEKQPLERACRDGELSAYKHKGFWQCMDTKREKDSLEKLWKTNKAPWKRK